jgi:hypothetical protein
LLNVLLIFLLIPTPCKSAHDGYPYHTWVIFHLDYKRWWWWL